MLAHLGIPIDAHKTVGPSTCITFLGILIDTEALELRLLTEKLTCLQELVQSWIGRKACTRRELESLVGHLSHAASVVRPGRTFLRQLLSMLKFVRSPNHYVRLNLGARADLTWWRCFLETLEWDFILPSSVDVYSDASGNYGCGAVVSIVGWFRLEWPDDWRGMDNASKELVHVVIAAALWGKSWRGQRICFHSDSITVVAILKSRTAGTPLLMHLLRNRSSAGGMLNCGP